MKNNSLIQLRELLNPLTDFYGVWHFYFKDKMLSGQLIVRADDPQLTNASLNFSQEKGVHLSSWIIKLTETDCSQWGLNYFKFRNYFPGILLFPQDQVEVIPLPNHEYQIKLITEDKIFRPLVEDQFTNGQDTIQELITRLNLNLRMYNPDLRKLLEGFNLPTCAPDEDIWIWFNQQDSNNFWLQLQDVQQLFEILEISSGPGANCYYLSEFEILHETMQNYLNNN